MRRRRLMVTLMSRRTVLMLALVSSPFSTVPLLAQTQDGPKVLPPPGALHPLPSGPSELRLTLPTADETNTLGLESAGSPNGVSGEVLEALPTQVVLVPTWKQAAYWFGPAPWDIGFELGINGSDGVNESLSLRTGGHMKRKTEFWKFDTSLVYNKNTANSIESQNNALLDVRIDRLLGDSPWTLFFLNQELYDEFQAFDLRVSLNAGGGYQFIDNEWLNLIGRFGSGVSREFGAPDERWAEEALFGLDYEHKLSNTQRLTATVDYFPEWKNFHRYRVVTDLGWEIDLDRPNNMSLKLSVLDRYDSTPNGVEPNELNYAALLIWGL